MNLSKLALAGAIAGLLSAATASAQTGPGQPTPATVQETAFEYNSYYAADDAKAPAEKPAEAAPAAAGTCTTCNAAGGTCNTCANACCDDGCGLLAPGSIFNPCCNLGEQWKIFDCPCLKSNNINIAGYMAQSYTWNPSNPQDRFNGPVTWTDRANEYQLNQLYLYAEKTTNTGGCGVDFGYRGDIMFGTDYRFNTEGGLETRGPVEFQNPRISTQRFYGTAFTQFYGEVAIDDWKIKVGHWYAPVGYEVVMTNANFFPSLPMTFQYGEPFTMTGVVGTYQYNADTTIVAGINHGWDNFDNQANPHAGFIGGYNEKFSDGSSIALANTVGNEPNATGSTSFRYLQTNVYSRPLKQISDKLTYVAQSDFGTQDNATLQNKNAKWYGLNQYLFYKVSDCLTYGIRYEWFRDQDGYRVGGFLGTVPGQPQSTRGLSTDRSGYAGSFYEITAGANYKFSANTTIRPYVRFDWFSGTSANPNGVVGNPERPYDGGFGNSQTLLGFDLITLY